ncbi:hypothetical protein IHE45_05G216200 [Dioscorea alata]|uniref:Uncharacterized protein n=1 Tax=Dioscorea alata TaxID=55571 RepID=A0ACB7W986_DIOAL|nr:hypothetical protein IHE45_05G216200 [Dioscorea alata]
MKYQTKLFATSLFLFFLLSQCFLFNIPVSTALMEGSKDDHHHHILKDIYGSKSSLPDCSHACGPCFPCKRVIVSFKCSLAESCPIVYRCMCNGKYYHVPSN